MRTISLGILCALVSVNAAHAGTDWKTYPATGCVADGLPQATANIISYDGFGGVCNQSTQVDVDLVCPVVREYSTSRFPIEAHHGGRSGHPNDPLTCTLRAMKAGAKDSGTEMADYFHSLTPIHMKSGNEFAVYKVYTDMKSSPNPELSNHGGMILTCRLPRSSYRIGAKSATSCLYNYSINEWDGN